MRIAKQALIRMAIGLTLLAGPMGQGVTQPEPVGTPPKTLYHFGAKDLLMKDVAAKTVPPRDWEEKIMGETTRFSLPRFRRGLYGSNPAGASLAYADTLIGTPQLPWRIAITIKDECRAKERTLKYSPFAIYADPKFQSWYAGSPARMQALSLDAFTDKCFPVFKAGLPPSAWYRTPVFALYHEGSHAPPKIQECEATVGQFLEEAAIGVVADDGWGASWYVRDRACLQTITGDDEAVLEAMAGEPDFWDPKTIGEPLSEEEEADQPAVGTSYAVMLLDALLTRDALSTELPARILENVGRFSVKDTAFSPARTSLEALASCRKFGKVEAFRGETRKLLADLKEPAYVSGKALESRMQSFAAGLSRECR